MSSIPLKRAPSPANVGPSAKKQRAASSSTPNGHVHMNGAVNARGESSSSPGPEDPTSSNLEKFRKEALFRRMRQYARDHARAEGRITELETRKRALESAIVAVETCWNQILDQLYTIVKPDTLALPAPTHMKELLHLVKENPSDSEDTPSHTLADALEKDAIKTQNLIAGVVALGPSRPTPEYDELLTQCKAAAAEATVLRSELHLNLSELNDTKEELDKYKESLRAAETREERARSDAVHATEAVVAPKPISGTKNGTQDVDMEDSGSSSRPKMTGDSANQIDILTAAAERKEAEIESLGKEKITLSLRIAELEAQTASQSDETLQKHPAFQSLYEQLGSLKEELERVYKERDLLKEDLEARLAESKKSLEDAQALREAQAVEFEQTLQKKNKELTKTKDARDSAAREATLLKAAETSKLKNTEAVNGRVQSLEDRVASLVSEVKRLKTKLAAESGQEDILAFLLSNPDESVTYVQDLRTKFRAAQTRLDALEITLSTLDQSHPDVAAHLRAEAQAREECMSLRTRLDKFESVFGSSLSGEAAALAERLKEKEEIIKKMKLAQEQEAAASNGLFEELQRMSSAWDVLDKQSKAKIDNVASLEAKYNRVTVEKAKADQKYFTVMREKEALAAENKAAQRNVAKQTALLAKLHESDKAFENYKAVADREIDKLMAKTEMQQRELEALRLETETLARDKVQLEKDNESRQSSLEKALEEGKEKRTEIRKLEDEFAAYKKTLNKETVVAKKSRAAGGSSSAKEEALQEEVDKFNALLRCSTCHQNYRSHILLKCMHTFCKSCIDARIATRQRKCPACGMRFTESEFQMMFLQ